MHSRGSLVPPCNKMSTLSLSLFYPPSFSCNGGEGHRHRHRHGLCCSWFGRGVEGSRLLPSIRMSIMPCKTTICRLQHTPSSDELKNKEDSTVFRSTYSYGTSHNQGYLKVSDIHTIYYEVFGNPCGRPAVFFHGGPGAGCSPRHAGFFDPKHYRIVLFDQRGCGKSSPRGCLLENTTGDLVEDAEKLRNHLGLNKWVVMGGSWGVTLGLAYSQKYPDSVSALILRGVCMLRQEEIDWFYKQGANFLFPFAWDKLVSVLDIPERDSVIPSLYRLLTSGDSDAQLQAAQALLQWEMGLCFFPVSQNIYSSSPSSSSSSPLDGKHALNKSRQSSRETGSKQGQDSVAQQSSETVYSGAMPMQVAQARLQCHYFINQGFLEENQLLEGVSKIRSIPCVIVHGQYDFVCPLKNAFDLHRAWPEAELHVVANAGHSMYEKGISHQLVCATDKFRFLT